MTNHRDEAERDPALARAWAAQSRETPPPALDQALLAAAHRAVGAGPRDATEAAAQARRPQRWWMPLAAAAVIGVVAIGVIQMMPETQLLTPHEKLMPLPQETASAPVVAAKPDAAKANAASEPDAAKPDAAKANAAAEPDAAKRDAASKRIAQSPPQRTAEVARADAPPSVAAPSVAAPSVAAPSGAVPSEAVPSGAVPSGAVSSEAVPSGAVPSVAAPEVASRPARTQATGGRADVIPKPAPAPVPAPAPTAPAAPATAGKLADAPVPFPAATDESKTELTPPPSTLPTASAELRAMPAPAAPAAPVRTPFGTNETRKERQVPAAAAPSPPPPLRGAPSEAAGMAASPPAPARDMSTEREGVRRQASTMAQTAPTTPAKSATPNDDAQARARDPEAWLVRIRKLRDDGDNEGAARELREFRSLVPDADARIPPDLRDWAATIR